MHTTLPKPKAAVAVAAFAAFLATFNETFMNVAFAPIMFDMNVDVATVQWLATAYMLGAAVMVPVSAFAYRSIKTRPLFLATVGLLVAGSVVGALAPTFSVLLVGRIIQALGTGMLIPVGMNITLEVAPREKLGTYMGIMGAMTTLGPSSSVIVAGLLLSVASWHALLWTFAALSALCFACGAAFLGDVAKLTCPRLDAVSVALVGVSLVGILYGVSTAFSGNLLIAAAAALLGAACLTIFVLRQKRIEHPLVDLRPLSVVPFALGVVMNMLVLTVIFAMNIVIPLFMQGAQGATSLGASLTLFPAILLSCVVAPLAGRVYDRFGARVLLLIGFALVCVFSAAVPFGAQTGSFALMALLYVPVICGSALIIGPVQSFALSHLDAELNPHGVTLMSTGFQIAGCFGSSVFTGVFSAVSAVDAVSGTAQDTAFIAVGALAAAFALVGFLIALYTGRFAPRHHTEEPVLGAEQTAGAEV